MDEMTLTLKKKWLERLRFRAEGERLRAEERELRVESVKLWTEGKETWEKSKELMVEAERLWEKSKELMVEGDKLWIDAVQNAHGDTQISLVYRNGGHDCYLLNGDVYLWDMKEGE